MWSPRHAMGFLQRLYPFLENAFKAIFESVFKVASKAVMIYVNSESFSIYTIDTILYYRLTTVILDNKSLSFAKYIIWCPKSMSSTKFIKN